jgi:anti-sigma regulatory factor (Ser/Thr protein kinase)
MILNLALDLPEDGYYLHIARLLSRTLLAHLRVVNRDIDDTEIVIGELCANVLRHSGSADGRFRITLQYFDDRIDICVEDKGQGFSMNALAPVGSERADFDGGRRFGGFGLQLIESLSDKVEFRSSDPHGTTARATKLLHYASQADADEAAEINASSSQMSIRMREDQAPR